FRAALEALDRGDWSTACPKFDASMRLDPSVSTLLNLARCHARDGKLALAWSECQRALVMNRETPGTRRRDELEGVARRLTAEIGPRLAKVRLRVTPVRPDLRVRRDGVEIPPAALGEGVPVDPGPHEIVAEAAGFVTARVAVTLREGETMPVEITLSPSAATP